VCLLTLNPIYVTQAEALLAVNFHMPYICKQGDSLFNTFLGLVFSFVGVHFDLLLRGDTRMHFDLRKSHQTTMAQREGKATTIYASILFFFFHDSPIQLYQSLMAQLGHRDWNHIPLTCNHIRLT
jgi:hypothetical protein